MSTRSPATRREGTIAFLPHRLNRQPVVVRGLTADELWMTTALSGAVGLLIGTALAIFFGQAAMAPTLLIISVAVGFFLGGNALRKSKRGRPETWLYRHLQWWISTHVPILAAHCGGRDLITHSGPWTVRREKHR